MLWYHLAEDGGLLVRSAGWNSPVHGAFTPDCFRLMGEADTSLELPWDSYLPPTAFSTQPNASATTDGWSVTFTQPARPNMPSGGVAIRLHGRLCSHGAPFRLRNTPRRRRLSMFSLRAGPHRIPLSLRGKASFVRDETILLSHLFWLMLERQDVRHRIAEPDRMKRFVEELRAGEDTVWAVSPAAGSSDTMNVRVAMEHCGFRHSFGRPIRAGDTLPHDEVVDAVLERLATSKDPKVLSIGRSWVSEVVRIAYTDVEPWPFAALVD